MDLKIPRIGTTSYMYPGTALYNAERISAYTDDIEVLYYEQGYSIPAGDLERMSVLAEENGNTYTVHLPVDLYFGRNRSKRESSIEDIKRIAEETEILRPYAYIIHLEYSDQKSWPDYVEESIDAFCASGIPLAKLCVENLGYSLDLVDELVERKGCSYCLDLGHFISHGFEYRKEFEKYIDNCRVIHLYSTDDKHSHHSLRRIEENILKWFAAFITGRSYSGLITLEMFSWQDYEESYSKLKKVLLAKPNAFS